MADATLLRKACESYVKAVKPTTWNGEHHAKLMLAFIGAVLELDAAETDWLRKQFAFHGFAGNWSQFSQWLDKPSGKKSADVILAKKSEEDKINDVLVELGI